MSSREEFEAFYTEKAKTLPLALGNEPVRYAGGQYVNDFALFGWMCWQASRAHESDLLAALKAITNSGPDAIPIKEAFEMAHRAIERASGGRV